MNNKTVGDWVKTLQGMNLELLVVASPAGNFGDETAIDVFAITDNGDGTASFDTEVIEYDDDDEKYEGYDRPTP